MVDKYNIQNNELATSELNKRAIRIINTVLRNYKSYDIKIKGFLEELKLVFISMVKQRDWDTA